jgi:hypothetical protein
MKYVLDDLDSDFSLNINYCIIFRENKKNINFIMLLLFSPTCRYTSESVLIVSYCDVLSLLFGWYTVNTSYVSVYSLQVVPTVYTDIRGRVIYSNQVF